MRGFMLLVVALTSTPAIAFDAPSVYKTKCASCHGEAGKGDGPVGKLMNPPIAPLPAACNPAVVLSGRGRMPGFSSSLAPADAEALCGVIRSFPR